MRKLGLVALLVSVFIYGAHAQYVFKVLAAKGNNQVFTNGAWTNLTAGGKVNKGEKLKLDNGGYLGLIHPSSGKTIELKTAGTFDVATLESKIISGKADFGTKYANYVQEGMFSSNPGAVNSYDRTGTVERKIPGPINIYAPNIISVIKSEPLKLHWNNCGKNQVYVITLSDFFQNVIFTKKVDTNYVVIDFKQFAKGNASLDKKVSSSYLLKIESETNPKYTSATSADHSYTIEIMSDEQDKAKSIEIAKVKQTIDKTSAMDHLVLAMAYEKAGLPIYAIDSYAKAKQLEPDVDAFSIQFEEYVKFKSGANTLLGGPTSNGK
jgi:hypothetical protein